MEPTAKKRRENKTVYKVNNSISSHRIHHQQNTTRTTPQQMRILLGFLSFFSASCNVSMGPMGRSQERVCTGAGIVEPTAKKWTTKKKEKRKERQRGKRQKKKKEKNYIDYIKCSLECSLLLSHRVGERNERVPGLQRYLLPLATAVNS